MKGLVTKSTGSWYRVKYGTAHISCRIKGKFRLEGLKHTNPITVGDYVNFEIEPGQETGITISYEKPVIYPSKRISLQAISIRLYWLPQLPFHKLHLVL
jgi:ribosome biogenesis GTPase